MVASGPIPEFWAFEFDSCSPGREEGINMLEQGWARIGGKRSTSSPHSSITRASASIRAAERRKIKKYDLLHYISAALSASDPAAGAVSQDYPFLVRLE